MFPGNRQIKKFLIENYNFGTKFKVLTHPKYHKNIKIGLKNNFRVNLSIFMSTIRAGFMWELFFFNVSFGGPHHLAAEDFSTKFDFHH